MRSLRQVPGASSFSANLFSTWTGSVCSGPNSTTWMGVLCTGGRVSALRLGSVGLVGSLPPAWSQLSALTELHIRCWLFANLLSMIHIQVTSCSGTGLVGSSGLELGERRRSQQATCLARARQLPCSSCGHP